MLAVSEINLIFIGDVMRLPAGLFLVPATYW